MQTVYTDPEQEGWFGCLPNLGYVVTDSGQCVQYPPEGEAIERDCDHLQMCLGSLRVCECSADGCVAQGFGQLELDLELWA